MKIGDKFSTKANVTYEYVGDSLRMEGYCLRFTNENGTFIEEFSMHEFAFLLKEGYFNAV